MCVCSLSKYNNFVLAFEKSWILHSGYHPALFPTLLHHDHMVPGSRLSLQVFCAGTFWCSGVQVVAGIIS